MKMIKKLRTLTLTLAILALSLLVPALTRTVYAGADASVKYSKAKKCYYLCDASGKTVTVPGLYRLDTTANRKKFSGIYCVTADGKIRTSSGIRYAEGNQIDDRQYSTGYYYFTSGGRLAQKAGVAYCADATVNKQNFHGYYYYNSQGQILSGEHGLIRLNCSASNGKKFSGYYYREAKSRVSTSTAVRNIKLNSGANASFRGFRFFAKGGKMSTERTCRHLNLTTGGTAYKGYYCFTGTDGKLIRTPGLVSMDRDVYYYVADNTGKCLTNKKKTVDGFTYSFDGKGVGKRITTKLSGLEKKLKKQLSGYGGTWSVYVKRLDNNDSLTINDRSLYAASLIKVFVMASLYNQIDQGAINSSNSLTGLTRSMITVSSNDAFNELVKRQTKSSSFSKGRTVINSYLSKNNYRKTSVHHTLHPSGYAYAGDGGRNVTSVADCGALLESIYRGTCVSKASSKQMLNFLLAQQRRWKIPSGVPSGTRVANKTGETNSSDHDIAIVYSPKCTYILCVMSQNAAGSSSRIQSISRTVYNYFN